MANIEIEINVCLACWYEDHNNCDGDCECPCVEV